jgi:ubiquinone/menaquinone biosynthesis C-methylase UbiE
MASSRRAHENVGVFNRTARWYDAFYAHLDYEAEAKAITAIIRELNPGAQRLLDVACGTGRHLAEFRRPFDCAGTDVEPDMVAVDHTTGKLVRVISSRRDGDETTLRTSMTR